MSVILVSAIVSGSIYALISLGFSLSFRISSVFNLTYGILVIAAAYLHATIAQLVHSPYLSIIGTLALMAAFGYVMEALAVPAAKRAGLSSPEILIISWLGMLIIQNALLLMYSSESIYLGGELVNPQISIWIGHVTFLQIVIVVLSIIAWTFIFVFVQQSKIGRQVLAVGDNARLASIYGINTKLVIGLNSIIAAVLTGAAGIMLSYEQQLDPALGFRFSIIGITSALIGFPLGLSGAIVGAYVLALFESLVLYGFDPRLRNAAVYMCLCGILFFTYRKHNNPGN